MKIIKKRLKSGLRTVLVPMKDNPTVTVLVLVETGSKYESKEENGISHFLEHMCFKGTSKRLKSFDISRELDEIGAQNNAFTSHEFTGYYAKAHPKHTKKILDVVSDLYLNPTFPEAEVQKEKGVIIEEMNMYEDLPQRQVYNVFSELLYGDTPAGRTVLGEKKVILSATRETFVSYRAKHYVADATTVVVTGNINPIEVQKEIEKVFSHIPQTKKAGKEKVVDKQDKASLKIKQKTTDQTHLMLGVRTFKVTDKRGPVLQVINAVLGHGMSSRLFQKLREEMGVGYYVRSGTDDYTDHGYLAVNTGVDKTRVAEVVKAVIAEFQKLKDEPVSASELAKAKESLLGSLVMELESSDSVAEFVGGQEVLKGEIKTPKEIEKSIRAVTPLEVQKLAKTIFVSGGLNLAIVGNIANSAEIKKLLSLK